MSATQLRAGLRAAVESALGSAIVNATPVTGGDINDTFVIELARAERCFLKTHTRAPHGMYAAEAHGLGWLAAAHAVRVPKVIAVAPPDASEQFLVIEHMASAAKARDHDEQLGRGLAALHRATPAGFGLDRDNFIALLPQANRVHDGWASFYGQQRLEPMLRRASDAGRATAGLRRAVTDVLARLDALVGTPEPPARLHGDLWGGNAITDERGQPVLIDPAVYGGQREVDLAMMQLFGGFGPRVFDAYAEAYPLSAGHAQRVPLYQLYPLLVHVCLFGGHYAASAEQAARRALA